MLGTGAVLRGSLPKRGLQGDQLPTKRLRGSPMSARTSEVGLASPNVRNSLLPLGGIERKRPLTPTRGSMQSADGSTDSGVFPKFVNCTFLDAPAAHPGSKARGVVSDIGDAFVQMIRPMLGCVRRIAK